MNRILKIFKENISGKYTVDGCSLIDVRSNGIDRDGNHQLIFVFDNDVGIKIGVSENLLMKFGSSQLQRMFSDILDEVKLEFRRYCAQNVNKKDNIVIEKQLLSSDEIINELEQMAKYSSERKVKKVRKVEKVSNTTSRKERRSRRNEADKMWTGMNRGLTKKEKSDERNAIRRQRRLDKKAEIIEERSNQDETLSRFQDILEEN